MRPIPKPGMTVQEERDFWYRAWQDQHDATGRAWFEGYQRARAELAHVVAPFAQAAAAHGVKQGKDDLWVSLGVAGSAWVNAREALKEGTST